MQAVVIREHGDLDALRFEQLPDPQAGAGEVRLAVKAVGLNHLDTWVRRGVPGHTFPLPMIPGCDFSGVVDQVGPGVKGVAVGDRVLVAPGFSCGRCEACLSGQDQLCRDYGIFGETTNGGCADFAVVPAVNVIPLPAKLEFTAAAAFPLTFLTAWHMLVARCGLRPGDDVLVHAAGSGVGSAAVQIARLFGARVIATAGSDRKLEQARALGAEHAINYETRDWVAEVRKLTGRRGVDIVVEHVGEKTFPGSLKVLAKGGRVVTCGATSGSRLEANLQLIFFKSLSILGSTMGSRGELLRIVELVARGQLRPVVDRVLPLSQLREAHEAMGRREQFGKIVLVPDGAG
ncbi:MAG TPA: zinc-binding dehydrogenase [Planctomycetota bacterium]|nr:zinc-binding dehydrogenase [Planctomycetota bacterium]